jgi:hypothetical protein
MPRISVSEFNPKENFKIRVSTYFAIEIGRGYIVYLMNVPVCWRSKAQRGVTLSSSEAVYMTISEAVKEIKFIYYLLQWIRIDIEVPTLVKIDNIGAMFMA